MTWDLESREDERFLAAMIGEGFSPAPEQADTWIFCARGFARTRGQSYGGAHVLAEFGSGTYIENGRACRWFAGLDRVAALQRLREEQYG